MKSDSKTKTLKSKKHNESKNTLRKNIHEFVMIICLLVNVS